MVHPNIKFLRAAGTMIGSIVGVGVFALPYAFAQSGFVVGALWLLALAALLGAMHLMYAEVVLQTAGVHRLSGYVEKYLGPQAGFIALFAVAGATWSAMVAYLIVGGKFLHVLLSPAWGGDEWMYAMLFAGLGALLIWRGIKFASKIEVAIICVILFLFTFAILAALPHLHTDYLSSVHASRALLPYGVALFALSGLGATPEMKLILGKKQEKKLPHAIMLALSLIVALYFFFGLAVVGATGPFTTQAAFDGLIPLLGGTFAFVGALLGSITVLSVYMLIGNEFQNSLLFDRRLGRPQAFLCAAVLPAVIYLSGSRSFIDVIGFAGTVFAGSLGILVVLTYEKMRRSPICERHHCLNVPSLVSWFLIAIFAGGILLEILSLFS